jgi:APA family basic amino acid/polyamine antiporter
MAANKFQNIAMFVKLGALAIISIDRLIKRTQSAQPSTGAVTPISSAGFLRAWIIVIFAFDGWMVAPSIAHEIKNPKRNLPLALMIAPLMITAIYLAYFLNRQRFQNNVLKNQPAFPKYTGKAG